MKRLLSSAAVAAVLACSVAGPAPAAPRASEPTPAALPALDIPYSRFVLGNGLTLIVHEDHKAPIVAVNIWYHVGSRNEPPGKTGFAHLFEHLMFNGSAHFNDDWFKALEKLGATDMNGTTNEDRTNYFENVPVGALDQVLWLESDRMGHLAEAIDKAKLDEQRGVVQNEKRQDENQPYAAAGEIITESTYHRDHPYGHTVIGSMADLDAASLEDVKAWFAKYYGPSNAVVVLAGDITAAEAKAKVEKYFGDIPPGPPLARQTVWPARMTGEHRAVMQDRVSQPRLYKVWNVSAYGAADTDYLDLLSDVLSSDKTARLYERLVYRDQIATEVGAAVSGNEIGGQFVVTLTGKPGVDPARLEAALDEEMARLLRDGPTPAEAAKIKTARLAAFVRGAERIGGFGGKSDILAQSQVFAGSPDAYKQSLERVRTATPEQLRDAGRRWLSDGAFSLTVTPFPDYAPAATGADRSKPPPAAEIAAPRFDPVRRATLSNGMAVLLVERHATPTVQVSVSFDTGRRDVAAGKAGLADLTFAMLDESAGARDALALSRRQSELGAALSAEAGAFRSTVSLAALTARLDPSLDLLADVALSPAFRQDDFDRVKALTLADLRRQRESPESVAFRLAPAVVFGQSHPLGRLATEASVTGLDRKDVQDFYAAHVKPQEAAILVVGDTTLEAVLPKLEARFGGWRPPAPAARPAAPAAAPARRVVYLVDKPGAEQSVILAVNPAPPRNEADEPAIEAFNDIFGGAFVSRLNMNLREAKHWSYGASSFTLGSAGPRGFGAYAPVQTDKTGESLAEVRRELADVVGASPPTADELQKAKDDLIRTLPGYWETAAAVRGSLGQMVLLGLPADHYDRYPQAVRALTVADVARAARTMVRPDETAWIVVGDRARIEKTVRGLNLGEVRVVDADGEAAR
ncbi:MAG: insulinase family protein [Caulobacteraceae bacterium]|nr:insulinase family protein [Caulobacteraceae bacterium]